MFVWFTDCVIKKCPFARTNALNRQGLGPAGDGDPPLRLDSSNRRELCRTESLVPSIYLSQTLTSLSNGASLFVHGIHYHSM